MEAKKCDRCGKYYTPTITAGEPTGRFGMLSDNLMGNTCEECWFDLCSDCWRELIDFKHNVKILFKENQ